MASDGLRLHQGAAVDVEVEEDDSYADGYPITGSVTNLGRARASSASARAPHLHSPPSRHPSYTLLEDEISVNHDSNLQEYNPPSPSHPPFSVPVLSHINPEARGVLMDHVPGEHRCSPNCPCGASIEDRQRIFGRNVLPPRQGENLISKIWLALREKALAPWSIATVTLLVLSLFLNPLTKGTPVDWVEGIKTVVAVYAIILAGSLNQGHNKIKEDRIVKVLRNGSEHQIDVQQVVVGDVVRLEPGKLAPCDGVFLSGHNVLCDESAMTGHADEIMKISYDDCKARHRRLSPVGYGISEGDSPQNSFGMEPLDQDCFLIAGSKVLAGNGSYVVTSVGIHCLNGRITTALRGDSKRTPLRLKLNDVAGAVTKIFGSTAKFYLCALLILIVQFGASQSERTRTQIVTILGQLLIIAITGLPFAIALTSVFATKLITKENIFVRSLKSCETIAEASIILTDKTGTLTQNEMTVVAASVGVHAKFVRKPHNDREWIGNEETSDPNSSGFEFAVNLSNLNSVLTPQLAELFNAAVVINSTAFEDADPESASMFIGGKTETALLKFAKELDWANLKAARDVIKVLQMIPFSSDHKSMGCVVRLPDGGRRLYIKGASEILTQKCTRHVVVYRDAASEALSGNGVETVPIGVSEENHISRTIESYASQMLRTIALCYRDFSHWPPACAQVMENDEVEYDDLVTDLTLIGVVGIEDPLREGVQEAVANCNEAGVRVVMCTGDNVLTAQSIAQKCGVYTPGGIIMEGPYFRALPHDALKVIAPQLQILARSTPEDKRFLVEILRECGDIVCVAGDGTNDGLALNAAHVGFSMGIAGTEVAKEASDIILMDDNFSSIVKAILWGRSLNDFVRKFLQFQMSAKIPVAIATLASSLLPSLVLNVAQLLWILTIVDVFTPLALAAEPAKPALLMRRPNKMTPLFTAEMIKHILGQSAYQILVLLFLHLFASRIPECQLVGDPVLQSPTQTLVFNTFVFAQLFNTFNSRRLDIKLNVFEGISNNWSFILIVSIEVAVHVFIYVFASDTFHIARIHNGEWVVSIVLGFISLPLGALIRLIPNKPCERIFKGL